MSRVYILGPALSEPQDLASPQSVQCLHSGAKLSFQLRTGSHSHFPFVDLPSTIAIRQSRRLEFCEHRCSQSARAESGQSVKVSHSGTHSLSSSWGPRGEGPSLNLAAGVSPNRRFGVTPQRVQARLQVAIGQTLARNSIRRLAYGLASAWRPR